MKIIYFLTILFSFNSFSSDYKFDSKSSTMIPKFAGQILLQRGETFVLKKNGKKFKAFKGTKVYNGQIIINKKKSIVKLKLVDQTILSLGPSSKLRIDKFVFRTQQDRDSIITLLNGKLRSHYRVKSKKKDQLRINIGKVASMGIRGTKVLANLINGKVNLALLEGKAEVTDILANKQIILKNKDFYNGNTKRRLTNREIATLRDGEREDLNNFLPFLDIAQVQSEHQDSIRKQEKLRKSRIEKEQKGSCKNNLNKLNNQLND